MWWFFIAAKENENRALDCWLRGLLQLSEIGAAGRFLASDLDKMVVHWVRKSIFGLQRLCGDLFGPLAAKSQPPREPQKSHGEGLLQGYFSGR